MTNDENGDDVPMRTFRYIEAKKSKSENATAKTSETIANAESCDKNKMVDSEFVSDTFHASEKDLEEVKAGMKMLGIDTLATQTNANGKKHALSKTC